MEKTRNLPIGIQSFSDIRERECIYVDKTQFIPTLLSSGKQYFLARPRRFGKSLFISTLKAYFLGKKKLFNGLALETLELELAEIQNRDAWIERPVFHIDLAGQIYNEKKSLEETISTQIKMWENYFGLPTTDNSIATRLRNLIIEANKKTGHKAVVLVDEYDKPLLDSIGNEELLDWYRTILKGFYGTLNPMDEYLHFVFVTGITRFDKVSIFSDFNQLHDISLSEKYETICGITQNELEKNFVPEIDAMAVRNEISYDKCLSMLKKKYDGYHFIAGGVGVYNPFSVIYAFDEKKFGNYWFGAATPTFLSKMLKTMRIDVARFEKNVEVDGSDFESYHIDMTRPEPLLYQAGYLTIKDYEKEWNLYILGFPNEEVVFGFLKVLVPYYINTDDETEHKFLAKDFARDVKNGNIDSFMKRIQSLFAALESDKDAAIYSSQNNCEFSQENSGRKMTGRSFFELDGKQIFFLIFKLMGEFILTEIQNGDGRSDAVVWTAEIIYVFEFKLDGTVDEALAQIDDKKYAVAYQTDGRKIVKVGAVFSSTEKTISDWKCVCTK